MNKLLLRDQLFDTLLKSAVTEDFQNELNAVPKEKSLRETYALSPELKQEINMLIKKECRRSVLRKAARIAKKAAVIIALIIPVSFGSLLSVEASRNAIFNAVLDWKADHVDIYFEEDSSSPSSQKAQEMDENESGLYQPQYLPEGFQKSEEIKVGPRNRIKYQNKSNGSIIFDQMPIEKSGTTMVDTEHATYKGITIQGQKAFLFAAKTPEDRTFLFWQNEKTSFELSSTISQQELIKVAESIQIQSK